MTSVTVAQEPLTPTTQVEVYIEANTNVPSFYQGRKEPSAGSVIRAVALVGTSQANLTYRWEIEGKIYNQASNIITFTAPEKLNVAIAVQVFDNQNTLIASKSLIVPLSDVAILFYEINPLFGSLRTPIVSSYTAVGEEFSVLAVPYFANTANPYLTWLLDGKVLKNQTPNPYLMTLAPPEESGSEVLGMRFLNKNNLSQQAESFFNLTY